MKPNTYTLRALSCLLRYPDAAIRAHLSEISEVIAKEKSLPASRIDELKRVIELFGRRDSFELEEEYVETFDRGRATSLHLFEHVYGDSRDRGPAMVDLSKTYEQSGLVLQAQELPDHLCVLLEFASSQPPAIAKEFLSEVSEILSSIFSALISRKSPYASIIAAVLELSGTRVAAVPFEEDLPLDDAWQEPVAFNGCSTAGQNRPGAEQPVHFVRKTNSQGVAA